MTLYAALQVSQRWQRLTTEPEPMYRPHRFTGAVGVPIFGQMAMPEQPRGTIIGTYGITGSLDNQWFLKLLGRKAFAQGYAVILFDWRGHGKTAEFSPTLTSDGLYEGEDFVQIAAQAKQMGYPAPFWFTGYSLGGQLALWGLKAAQSLAELHTEEMSDGYTAFPPLSAADIAGGAVICPSLDSNRSLTYLVQHPWGKYLERAISRELRKLAWQIYEHHPTEIDPAVLEQVNSIRGFDHELVIGQLGFASVEAYYEATSPLSFLPNLQKKTLILYAADDPLFDPSLVPDVQRACEHNPAINLLMTTQGGHVGYLSSHSCQRQFQDQDCWWAWNRVLAWMNRNSPSPLQHHSLPPHLKPKMATF